MKPSKELLTPEQKHHILQEAGLAPPDANTKESLTSQAPKSPNVTNVAKTHSASRATIYEWKKRFEQLGLNGLKSLPPMRRNPPPSVPVRIRARILKISNSYPEWGGSRISRRLAKDKMPCSATTVQKILAGAGRATRKDRVSSGSMKEKLKPKNARAGKGRSILTTVAAAKAKLKAAEVILQCVREFSLPPPIVGYYLHEAVDAKSSFAWALIAPASSMDVAQELIQKLTAVCEKTFGQRVGTVVTSKNFPNSIAYDSYREWLLKEKHIKHKEDGSCYGIHRQIADRFHEQLMATVHKDAARLKRDWLKGKQRVLDDWVEQYNKTPNDLNGGKRPWKMMAGEPK